MTIYAPCTATITAEVNSVAAGYQRRGIKGLYLTDFYGSTLDGSDVAKYLTDCGFTVLSYRDTGGKGLVELDNGVSVSTNGFCWKRG